MRRRIASACAPSATPRLPNAAQLRSAMRQHAIVRQGCVASQSTAKPAVLAAPRTARAAHRAAVLLRTAEGCTDRVSHLRRKGCMAIGLRAVQFANLTDSSLAADRAGKLPSFGRHVRARSRRATPRGEADVRRAREAQRRAPRRDPRRRARGILRARLCGGAARRRGASAPASPRARSICYFADKETLFQELVRSMLSPVVGTLEHALARRHAAPR